MSTPIVYATAALILDGVRRESVRQIASAKPISDQKTDHYTMSHLASQTTFQLVEQYQLDALASGSSDWRFFRRATSNNTGDPLASASS